MPYSFYMQIIETHRNSKTKTKQKTKTKTKMETIIEKPYFSLVIYLIKFLKKNFLQFHNQ